MEITAFADDSAVVAEVVPGETTLSGRDTNQHTDSMQHSVISFLQRPKLIRSFIWRTSAERDSDVAGKEGLLLKGQELIVPNSMLVPLVRNKLDGFTSLRATCVVKLQVNAQPFQAGRLLISAVPVPTLLQDRAVWIKKAVGLQQPINHVQLDISKQTEVSLRIPFVSPFNSFDLVHGEFPWAEVVVSVYSPLASVGDQTELECLMWYHFEDIELGAPTSGQVIPIQQSGKVAPREVPAPQLAQARAAEEPGIISSIAGTVKGISSGISDAIPVLKPIGGIVNTVADVVGGIAGIFGWSKPLIGNSGQTVVVRPTEYFANSDGIDHSLNLSLCAMNVVDSYPGLGGTNLDETALDFIKKIPQFIGYFTFSNTNKYNDFLYQVYVTPTYVLPNEFKSSVAVPPDTEIPDVNPGQVITADLDLKQPTSLHYISTAFAYWTGSMVYTLRFVKTNFHSGRVEISFHPFVSTVDKDRLEYVYRLVVDLRDNSEISFTVPYISPQPWKRVNSLIYDGKGDIPVEWSDVGRSITGVLYVRALTPLICATSIISPTIECLVEARAGDDFRLQAPTSSFYGPLELRPLPKAQSGKVYALPGTQETRTSSLEGFTPQSITGNDSDINRVDTQRYCAGEEFQSFRQLTRRYAFQRKFEARNDTIFEWFPTSLIRPPTVSVNYAVSPQPENTNTTRKVVMTFDSAPIPLSFVSAMYAFYRGGVRVKAIANEYAFKMDGTMVPSDFNPVLISGRINNVANYPDGSMHFGNNYISPIGYEQQQDKKFAEFKIPYYSPTLVSVHWTHEALSQFDQPQVALELTTSTRITPSSKPSEKKYINIAVAGADDLDFHLFLGAPPVINGWRIQETSSQIPEVPDDFNTLNMAVDPCYFLSRLVTTTKDYPCRETTDNECTRFFEFNRFLSAADFTVSSVMFKDYQGAWRKHSPRSTGNVNNRASPNKPPSDADYQRRLQQHRREMEERRRQDERMRQNRPNPNPPTSRKLMSVDDSDDEGIHFRVPDVIDSEPTWDPISKAWQNVILPPDNPRGR